MKNTIYICKFTIFQSYTQVEVAIETPPAPLLQPEVLAIAHAHRVFERLDAGGV